MSNPQPDTPRTAAGRALLDWNHECILFGEGLEAPDLLPRILAIEREAASPPTALLEEARTLLGAVEYPRSSNLDWRMEWRKRRDRFLAALPEPEAQP